MVALVDGCRGMRFAALTVFLLASAAMAGCATAARPDPIEGFNRKVFAFNEGLDHAVIKPVATGYSEHVPRPVKTGVSNFFGNARDLWSAANLFLQGEGGDGSRELARFGLNTTVGILGLIDVATSHGLERNSQSFGNTLGVWGIEPGAYVVLPLFGPSTSRNAAGLPLDLLATPLTLVPFPASLALSGTNLVSERAKLIPLTNMIDQMATDKYLYVRDAYLQRVRQSKDRDAPEAFAPVPAGAASASAAVPQ